MVAMVLYMRSDGELEQLKRLSKDATAWLSEESLKLDTAKEPEMAIRYLNQDQVLDLACMDVAKAEDIEILRELRQKHLQVEILLVADASVSPMEYLTPDIRASSLLLRPYRENQCRQVVLDFFRSYFRSREKVDEKAALLIENRDGKTIIPYRRIYYVEVRERKIFIRLKDKEYSIYDSLEHMLTLLPDTFLQCHRSFVFNSEHFDSVKLSENTIYLEHGISVPLSRSFKAEIKEFVNGLRSI